MIKVGVRDAKKNLSKLIAAAEAGEEVVITRRNESVVMLTPVQVKQRPRVPGRYEGRLNAPDSVFAPLSEEEMRCWE
jgi:prevent-host-death family protein